MKHPTKFHTKAVTHVSSVSKPTARHLASSHDCYSVTNRDGQHNGVSSDNTKEIRSSKSTLPGSTSKTILQGSTAKSTLPGSTVRTTLPGSTARATLPGSTARTKLPGSTARTTLPGNTAKTTLPGSRRSGSSINIGSSKSKITNHRLYCTEEEVERNMKL